VTTPTRNGVARFFARVGDADLHVITHRCRQVAHGGVKGASNL
jgi:hypothetical protein